MYRRSTRRWSKHLDFILLDELSLQLALVIANLMRHGSLPYEQPQYRALVFVYAIVDLLVAISFSTMHNVLKRGYWAEFSQTVKQVLLVLLSMALYLFAVQEGGTYSRLMILYTAIGHLALGWLMRVLWKRVLVAGGAGSKDSAMILVAEEATIEQRVRDGAASGVSFSGVVAIDRDAQGETIAGLPVVANLDGAAEYLRREWVDEVFICPRGFYDLPTKGVGGAGTAGVGAAGAVGSAAGAAASGAAASSTTTRSAMGGSSRASTPVADLIELCTLMAMPVHIELPLSSDQAMGKVFAEKVAGRNVITFASNYASGLQIMLKRLLDIVGGLVGSVFALIIMAIVGPIIKRQSPGPILFKQERIGLNGKRFKMYKLRSMYLDAEERKAELMAQNRVSDGMMFKLDWDPRIIGNRIVDGERKTGIGEFIRKTSLDEFPQFFNVLMGQMSLVGTRPPTVDEWEKYQYHHRARIATKPGITGMWQVSGRSEITDFEEVVRLDLEYIQNWSFGLDIKILFKTLKVVFAGHGAM